MHVTIAQSWPYLQCWLQPEAHLWLLCSIYKLQPWPLQAVHPVQQLQLVISFIQNNKQNKHVLQVLPPLFCREGGMKQSVKCWLISCAGLGKSKATLVLLTLSQTNKQELGLKYAVDPKRWWGSRRGSTDCQKNVALRRGGWWWGSLRMWGTGRCMYTSVASFQFCCEVIYIQCFHGCSWFQ